MKTNITCAALILLIASAASAQTPNVTNDPFPTPIAATDGVIAVKFTEFATILDFNGAAPRVMTMVYEPGTQRYFASDMNGKLYKISADGKTVSLFVDLTAADWQVSVQAQGSERGLQSFAFHPQFNQRGARGFGKFYTLLDSTNVTLPADFKPSGGNHTHDTVLLEWTAKDPAAAGFDGESPRELMRFEQPYANHNAGHMTFNPLARAGAADFGLLYVGFADGGSGGDPLNHGQNLNSAFGKILRIDPLGSNSANGKYGIPAANPFVNDGKNDTLAEIYAYGARNPQRLFWDPKNGSMFMSDIGQDTIEKISPVTAGANLGWNAWEGSFKFVGGGRPTRVDTSEPRSDPKITYPVVEYAQPDPLLQNSSAAIGGMVYRSNKIPQLSNLLIFGDNPSGEIFYVNADNLPKGGQDSIRRILLNDQGTSKTYLQVIREKASSQGRQANRADLRFAEGPDGQIFLLNKRDGTIRLLEP